MRITWDLLTCGGDLAPYPGALRPLHAPSVPGVYRSQEEGELSLPPVRWGEGDEALTYKLRWRPRRLELVAPDTAAP
jgi:hypothetical protein